MIQYPISFGVSSLSGSGIRKPWTSLFSPLGGSPIVLPVAIPQEFEGPGGTHSPEDFYSLALINCFVATFKVIAEKSKLEFTVLDCDGMLSVDRGDGGVPCMKAFHLKVRLSGVSDPERAKRILEKTSQSCLILNSVKTVKTFEFLIGE